MGASCPAPNGKAQQRSPEQETNTYIRFKSGVILSLKPLQTGRGSRNHNLLSQSLTGPAGANETFAPPNIHCEG